MNFGGRLAWPLLMAGVLVLCGLGLARGISQLHQVQEELQQVRATNLRLDRENNIMYRQVLRLRSDPQALERACRRDMGVVRSDEVVYQLEQTQAQPAPRPAGKDQP